KHAIELCRFLIEGGHVAIERRLEAIKDEVVVPIEPRIVEQDLRLAPGVDVIADKSVDENDHVLGLKNLVPQMQQPALVMGSSKNHPLSLSPSQLSVVASETSAPSGSLS